MRLFCGDNLDHLQFEEDNSIDAVVTDPPYGLSFMGKKWDYDVPSVEFWREVLRVMKPGAHVLSFGGTRTYHRMVVNMEDAGFEIRDQVQWIYGSGFPKSLNLKDKWAGWGTALKPANEPIVLARKPIERGLTVAENVLKWGTGAINVDASRIGLEPNVNLSAKQKNFDSMGYGGNKNTDGVDTYNPQGRWPANVLFDEDAAAMLDKQSGESKSGARPPTGKPKYTGSDKDSNAMRTSSTLDTTVRGHSDSGGASRFFYVAKASKRERNAGLEGMPEKEKHQEYGDTFSRGRNPKTGERTEKYNLKTANHHPTVKPIKLMEYLVKLITPPGGVVLDPFMGSGSTGVATKNLGFKFIGIELDEDYFKIAKKRIRSL